MLNGPTDIERMTSRPRTWNPRTNKPDFDIMVILGLPLVNGPQIQLALDTKYRCFHKKYMIALEWNCIS